MKKLNQYIGKALAAALVLSGCTYDPPAIDDGTSPVSAGNADFSNYVAIGNSLTAGFMDAALYQDGQENAFPAILANRFAQAGGGSFGTPILPGANGVNQSFPGAGRLIAAFPDCTNDGAGPVPTPGDYPSLAAVAGERFTGSINNFGVPGVKSFETLTPLLAGNPFYARIASDPGTSTLVGDAVAANPTFFTIWLGNNDVLGYATAGGLGNPNPDPTGPVGSTDMTPAAVFQGAMQQVFNAFLAVPNARGAVANIPDVTIIPYFTAVNGGLLAPSLDPCNPEAPASSALPFELDATTAAQLNGLYQLSGLGNPNFQAGKVNYPTIVTGDGTVRQMDPTQDFLVLPTPTDSLLVGALVDNGCDCNVVGARAGWGLASGLGTATPMANPIASRWVLDAGEVAAVQARTAELNGIINNLVQANSDRLTLVDINTSFNDVSANDYVQNGVTVTTNLGADGIFSWDGVHINPKGNAVVANFFIEAINSAFNSQLRQADIRNYRGQEF